MANLQPDWSFIKETWETNSSDLGRLTSLYGLSMMEISLVARREGWGDRDCRKGIVNFNTEVLTDLQVQLAHKTDLGRLRLMAACAIEGMRFVSDYNEVLKVAERLSKIYAVIIPLERKVFGMDGDIDSSPDGVIINIKGKK